MSLEASFPLLLDLTVKSTAILLLASAASAVWHRASAANRHLIWLAALLAVLLLPLTKLADPQWTYVWSRSTQHAATAPPIVTRAALPIHIGEGTVALPPPPRPRQRWAIDWTAASVLIWMAGISAVLLHRTGVRWRLARMAQRSRPVAAAHWPQLARECPAGVEIRESGECRVPLAAGVWRPIVLLPEEALQWSAARLAAALRHEFGHIQRRDCLTRLLLDFACAIYWPNPLMWLAARAMRVAQEQSCDDLVLRSGASAADYATQLIEVVRTLGTEHGTARHALAMAQPSSLETRVRAIVDGSRDRRMMSGATATLGLLGVALVLALCSVARLEGAEKKSKAAVGAKEAPSVTIEARFFELTTDSPDALAALPWLKENAGPKGAVAGLLTPEQATVVLRALSGAKGVDLLSAPRVFTRSGQRATIEIVREFRHPVDWKKDAKTGGWEPSKYDTKNTGVTFGIVADTTGEGKMDLALAPEITEFVGFRDLDAPSPHLLSTPDPKKPLAERMLQPEPGALLPAGHRAQAIFHTRNVDTKISVSSGQSVLLGLGISDVPDTAKRRLFVLVTAEVVRPELKQAAAAEPKPEDRSRVTGIGDVKVETPDVTLLAQNVEVQPKPAPTAAPKSAVEEKAEKIILPTIEFRDASVREAVAFLTKKSLELDPEKKGVNIVVKLPDADTTKLTLSLENIPLSEALRYLAGLADLKLEAGREAFLLRPRTEQAAALKEPAAGTPEALLLARARGILVPRMDFKEATVAEGVDFLRKKSAELDLEKKAVNIVLKPAPNGPETRLTLSLGNVSIAEALGYIAQLAGLELEVGPHAFLLRSPGQ